MITTFPNCHHQEKITKDIPKPVWAVGFALEQTLRDATLAVFSLLILKRLQHNLSSIHQSGNSSISFFKSSYTSIISPKSSSNDSFKLPRIR
ncbi:MAG: hypothetical protein LBH59_04160 [Planctomycetaceae bacterium]|nr:hypothetical protein [Planctomycetaceae bacterium]